MNIYRANDIYSRVGTNCPSFYPDFSSKKSCPEISHGSCRNCRNFNMAKNKCMIEMFDRIIDGMFTDSAPKDFK
ncbi:MAG: hypothetical protein IKM61_02860 [Eubacteriaceae bacterium]|nr:hypothetical protein [Eubacteriaceae bacterium]